MAPRVRLSRVGSQRLIAVLTAAAIALAAGWALLVGTGQPATKVTLASGGAWLLSPGKGYVTLIDGPSEQVVATVQAVSSGSGLSVAQDGSSAYLADDSSGTVSRIDGSTYEASRPVQFSRTRTDLKVLAGGDGAFVIDSSSRTATAVSSTLTVLRTVSLAARPGPQQTLISHDGRLWTVDADGTGLTWVDASGTQGRVTAAATATLVNVAGRAVLVDTAQPQPTVNWLNADGSSREWSCRLSTRAGDSVQLLGSGSGGVLFAAVAQSGTLVVARDTGDCGSVIPLAAPGSDFGGLVQSGRFVFVPNRSTGSTVVVDTTSAEVVADLPLTAPGNDLELTTKDGLVFYNDLSSERAGVLKLGPDGQWLAGKSLRKYNPDTGEAEAPVVTSQSSAVSTATPPSSNVSQTSDPPAGTEPSVTSQQSTTAASVTTSSTQSSTRTTTTTTRTSSSTTTTTTPIPGIVRIDGPSVLTDGAAATFVATVTNPSGAWHWTAIGDDGVLISQSADENEWTIAFTRGALNSVTITLIVGTSAPFSATFSFPGRTTHVVTEVSDLGPLWFNDSLQVVATVTDAAGNPMTGGTVTMEFTDTAQGTTHLYGTYDVVGGSVDIGSITSDHVTDYVVHIDYTPAAGAPYDPATADPVSVSWVPPVQVIYAVCSSPDRGTTAFIDAIVVGAEPTSRVNVLQGSLTDSGANTTFGPADMTFVGPGGGSGETLWRVQVNPTVMSASADIHIQGNAEGRALSYSDQVLSDCFL